MRVFLGAFLVMMAPALGFAQVTVSLPSQGYYRPGKFFPVRIAGDDRTGAIELKASGVVSTAIDGLQKTQVCIPMLAETASAGGLRWVSADGVEHPVAGELRPLGDREVLVGVAGGDEGSAQALLPGKRLVILPIDSGGELLEPPSAWELLDGLMLGASEAAQLSDRQIERLLAAGTVIAVRSPTAPAARWPWKKVGENWVLQHELAGPSSGIDADAYGPTYDWDRGWPRSFRSGLFGIASVFVILAVAISLWRSRFAVWAFAAFCVLASGVVGFAFRQQSPVRAQKLGVAIRGQGLIQYDLWSWESCIRETRTSFPAQAVTHPIFGSLSQEVQLEPRLVSHSDGQPDRLEFHLKPGESVAMLTRIVRPGEDFPALQPAEARWIDFVRGQYLRASDEIAGQTLVREPSTGELIPTVVVDRQ